MNRQDRQGARTPAQLEQKYNFNKSFAEVMGIATDARTTAEEAKKVATSMGATSTGLALKVKSLEEQVDGALALEILEENGNKYSQLRSDVDKVKFNAGEISIDSDNFSLTEDGEITAKKGSLGGWVMDEFGIHQEHGVWGVYTIAYTTTGTDYRTETYTGYLFYCLEPEGIFRYIFEKDEFLPYDPEATGEFKPYLSLWTGDMLGDYRITRDYAPPTEM